MQMTDASLVTIISSGRIPWNHSNEKAIHCRNGWPTSNQKSAILLMGLCPFRSTDQGYHKGLLVRHCLKKTEELAYYFTHAPQGTSLAKLVRVAGSRWVIEECFEQAKQETGLDEYEVRSWAGWSFHSHAIDVKS